MATIYHGSNKDCPRVLAGEWTRCAGHDVPDDIANGRTVQHDILRTLVRIAEALERIGEEARVRNSL